MTLPGSLSSSMSAYTLLYALSIIAINPWGGTHGPIWVLPKVLVLTALLVLNGFIIFRHAQLVRVDVAWRRTSYLWAALLGVGLLSTVLSPTPCRSLLEQSIYGDGWLYWLLVGGLVLTNALVVRAKPELFKVQLRGLLLGGLVFAASIFPQLLDRSLDYTVRAGQFVSSSPELLQSGVHVNHQPIGLTSHRGHASVVVALTCLLALVSLVKRWLNPWLVWPVFSSRAWRCGSPTAGAGCWLGCSACFTCAGTRSKRSAVAPCLAQCWHCWS